MLSPVCMMYVPLAIVTARKSNGPTAAQSSQLHHLFKYISYLVYCGLVHTIHTTNTHFFYFHFALLYYNYNYNFYFYFYTSIC